jgi:c(7)-type cytochrome triheme protein
VTFKHGNHLDMRQPQCLNCHTKAFKLLSTREASSNRENGRGKSHKLCGSCHDGLKAFGVKEDCSLCHKDELSEGG